MTIKYLIGDATNPIDDGSEKLVICHCCNNIGAWGAGFVMALSKRWPEPENEYKKWSMSNLVLPLGDIQIVNIPNTRIDVVNIIGQSGIRSYVNPHPIEYNAIKTGLMNIVYHYNSGFNTWSLHMPRMGAGLAGGDWAKIEDIINKTVVEMTDVYVYDLPS